MRDDSSRGGLRKVRPRTVLINRPLCSLVTSELPQLVTDEGIYGKVAATLVGALNVDDAESFPAWAPGYRIQARARVRDQDPACELLRESIFREQPRIRDRSTVCDLGSSSRETA